MDYLNAAKELARNLDVRIKAKTAGGDPGDIVEALKSIRDELILNAEREEQDILYDVSKCRASIWRGIASGVEETIAEIEQYF